MSHVNFSVCPFCGHEHDRAAALVKHPAPAVEPRMKPGDVTLCIECGEMSVLGFNEMLRKPSSDEIAMLGRDPAVQRVREAWQAMQQRRKQ
jgi:hypothetical protein